MTGIVARQCKEPGCPGLVTQYKKKYCDNHKHQEIEHRHNVRVKEKLPFYNTQQWKRVRLIKLKRDPVCEICNNELARLVHHIKDARNNPYLRYQLENLQSLCDSCHNKESQKERGIS